jgi:fermentation-respiration switch protein FrsA (DUF1100 family)
MLKLDSFFYYPDQVTYASPAAYGLDHESVFSEADDGVRLHGWFFPANGKAKGTAVHFHGNAGNISGHFEYVSWLPDAGWNVFCFDYRGYGQSEGKTTRAGTVSDGHAAINYVKERTDVEADRIVIFGQSLGGAVGIVVGADRNDVRGVATEGAFGSYQEMARHVCRHQPMTWGIAGIISDHFISADYDAIDFIARISPRPVYLVHGTADDIVPCQMTERLGEAAKDPKDIWIIDGVGHTDSLFDLASIARPRLTRFFERCVDP